MKRRYFIGVDVHCKFSEVAAVSAAGREVHRGRCATTIPALMEELDKVPRPRCVVIEEGPLADWLWQNLRPRVDEMVVSEPRRNRLIAQEGDKDDPLDAGKLAQLYRGGYTKAVHHPGSLPRLILKQHVGLYHWTAPQRPGPGMVAGAALRQSRLEERDPGSGQVGGRSRR